jgi:hypothetical protein
MSTPTPAAAHAAAPGVDLNRLLDAIACVENWNGSAVGGNGELGPFQFTRTTWEGLTTEPFSKSKDPAIARPIARLYLSYLAADLRRNGFEVSVANLATAFNIGMRGMILRKFHDPNNAIVYAQRVCNIYNSP